MPKFFLGLITRCKDEYFIKEFCDYYIKEGVDRIIIIDDDSNNKSIYKGIDLSKVTIMYSKNIINNAVARRVYEQIRNKFVWMINVDVDEFITTKKNPDRTIREELSATFSKTDCVIIPWAMMSCNGIEKSPQKLLLTNIHRWNHDKKHTNNGIFKFRCRYREIESKSIFKSGVFTKIDDHIPLKPLRRCIVVNGINGSIRGLNKMHQKLREKDIENGYFVCYHYRIISKENCLRKIRTNKWYKQFKLNDLMKSDHPEVVDTHMKDKVIKYDLYS